MDNGQIMAVLPIAAGYGISNIISYFTGVSSKHIEPFAVGAAFGVMDIVKYIKDKLGAIVGFKTTVSPISQKAVLIAIMAGTFSLFLARGYHLIAGDVFNGILFIVSGAVVSALEYLTSDSRAPPAQGGS